MFHASAREEGDNAFVPIYDEDTDPGGRSRSSRRLGLFPVSLPRARSALRLERLSDAQIARSISSPLCRRSQRGRSLLDFSFESSSLPILAHIRPLLNSQLHSATGQINSAQTPLASTGRIRPISHSNLARTLQVAPGTPCPSYDFLSSTLLTPDPAGVRTVLVLLSYKRNQPCTPPPPRHRHRPRPNVGSPADSAIARSPPEATLLAIRVCTRASATTGVRSRAVRRDARGKIISSSSESPSPFSQPFSVHASRPREACRRLHHAYSASAYPTSCCRATDLQHPPSISSLHRRTSYGTVLWCQVSCLGGRHLNLASASR